MTPDGALSETLAVLRSEDTALAAQLRAVGMRIVECANADDGMGASLACGVAAAPGADGWIIVLADMPWIAPATIAAVAAAIAAGAGIAAPAYRGERGHPVGFARRHLAALCALSGDSGARVLVDAYHDQLVLIDTDDPQVVRDVDVPEDLQRGRPENRRV
jgi:molybdenum cofactor cytidylyltransferase